MGTVWHGRRAAVEKAKDAVADLVPEGVEDLLGKVGLDIF